MVNVHFVLGKPHWLHDDPPADLWTAELPEVPRVGDFISLPTPESIRTQLGDPPVGGRTKALKPPDYRQTAMEHYRDTQEDYFEVCGVHWTLTHWSATRQVTVVLRFPKPVGQPS